jgi:hypothetical protein
MLRGFVIGQENRVDAESKSSLSLRFDALKSERAAHTSWSVAMGVGSFTRYWKQQHRPEGGTIEGTRSFDNAQSSASPRQTF